MTLRVHRYGDSVTLCHGVADRLAATIAAKQADGSVMTLCLSDGLAGICAWFGSGFDAGTIDPSRLDLWWSDERFVDITDPTRVSTQTLAAFGASWRFDPANVHPMPTASGNPDIDKAALQHAAELGDRQFDLAILAVGEDGAVAGLAPDSPAFVAPPPHTVTSVADDHLTLTLSALARSREVWLVACGSEHAAAVAGALAGDQKLPAGALRGQENTCLFVDDAAAALLPWHTCEL